MLYKEFQTSSREQISFEAALLNEGVQFQVNYKMVTDGGSGITTYYFVDEESFKMADFIEKRVMDEMKYKGMSPVGKFIIGLNLILIIGYFIIWLVGKMSEG